MVAQALAATAPNSQERFEARRVLPGMATCLRQVRMYASHHLAYCNMHLVHQQSAVGVANIFQAQHVVTPLLDVGGHAEHSRTIKPLQLCE